jgi:hypothetical protein
MPPSAGGWDARPTPGAKEADDVQDMWLQGQEETEEEVVVDARTF